MRPRPRRPPPACSLDRWWTAYGDAQLETLVERALASAPDVRSAQARLKEALAIRSEALDAFNPQGDLEASGLRGDHYRRHRRPAAGGHPRSGLVLGDQRRGHQHLWRRFQRQLGGRPVRAAARRRAEGQRRPGRRPGFDYEATRASLAANVADSLFQARGLAIQLDDAQEEERIERELAEVARRRAGHGVGPIADADQAAALAAQAEAQAASISRLHAARRSCSSW